MISRKICSLLVVLACATAASAQMIVHAMSGTVKVITANSIFIDVDGGSEQFTIASQDNKSLQFPAELRAGTTDAAKFQKTGEYVLLYYYGFGDQRTAVAVKELGAGPYTRVRGTVTAFDKHTHVLTLRDDGGKEMTLALGDGLVVDEDNGIGSGKKFSPHKGDAVRVVYGNGATPTVVFLRETL